MNKEHENINKKRTHAKPNTFVVEGDGDWFVANGYEHPDNLIDHDANLDEPEAFFGIFADYNQHNIANEAKWDTWPSWSFALPQWSLAFTF